MEPSDQSVVVGDRVTFDCSADGFPTPVIRWKISTGLYDKRKGRMPGQKKRKRESVRDHSLVCVVVVAY